MHYSVNWYFYLVGYQNFKNEMFMILSKFMSFIFLRKLCSHIQKHLIHYLHADYIWAVQKYVYLHIMILAEIYPWVYLLFVISSLKKIGILSAHYF